MLAKLKPILIFSSIAVFAIFLSVQVFSAGPTCDPNGVCSVLTTDGNGDFGIGVNAISGSKLYIKAGGTGATDYGLNIIDSGSAAVLTVAGDGKLKIHKAAGLEFSDGTIQTTAAVGSGVTSTPAGYITPGYFNSVAGTGGNYSFPASLSVGTSTAPTGGSLFVNGNVGIGTANVSARLNISGDSMSILMTPSSGDGGYLGNGGIIANNEFGLYDGGGDGIIAVINNETGAYYYGGGAIVSDGTSVGIGTVSPQYLLDVYGASNKLGLTYSHTDTYGSTGAELSADSSGDLHIIATRRFPSVLAKNILLAENNGKVGIATTTPAYSLSVAGTIQSSTGGFRFPDGTTQTTAATGGGGGSITTSSAVTAGYFPYWATGSSITGTSTIFQLGGNVGIGKTNPAVPLDVTGTISGTGVISAGTYFQAPASAITKYQPNGNADIQFADYAGNVKMVIDTSGSPSATGNVGVGTTTPNVKLEVFGTDNALRLTYDATHYASLATANSSKLTASFAGSGSTGGYLDITQAHTYYGFLIHSGATWAGQGLIGTNKDFGISTGATTQDIVFYGNNFSANENMRIKGTGNVGIATSTPTYPLTVAGTIHSSTGGYRFPDGTTQTTAATAGGGGYGWTTSGTSVILATSTNNVGIGQTPTYKLDVNGVIRGQGTAFSGDVLLVGNDAKIVDIDVLNTLGVYSQSTPTEGGILLGSSGPTIYGKSGNVGIATTTPGYPLTVNGTSLFTGTMTIGVGGAGKLNVGTIDPPYTINGEKFATYVSAMTGQKEETTGEILVTCPLRQSLSEASNAQRATCQASINFSAQEKGSDLWLFAKTTNLKTNFAKMTVLLTPGFDGKAWYEKDTKNSVLKVFVSPASGYSLTTNYYVSYRLTAPRFDAAEHPNTRNDDIIGIPIND